jgi:DNA end-binding protein Ku
MAEAKGARPIWTGAITFGLVNIPVRLYPAVREQEVHFHLLHDQDHARLQRRLVCSADGKEVHPEHIVKGVEVAPDQYVVVREEELEAVKPPKRARMIEIEDFVGWDEIDPVYFDRTYYVAPQEGGARAYGLLVAAMDEAKKVGIARFVLRSKEYLVALRTKEGMFYLETMHFGDEVLSASDLGPPPGKSAKPDSRELNVARQLVESLSGKFDPEKYHDEYRNAVRALIEKKAAGEEVVLAPEPRQEPARTTNLMAALQESLAKAKARAKEDGNGKTSPETPGGARKPGQGRTRRRGGKT